MLAAYVTVVALVVVCLVLGRAACVMAGAQARSWLAAPVGLALALMIALVAVRLPGAGVTALVVLAGAAVAGAVWLRGRLGVLEALRDGGPAALLTLAGASLPFLAAGRFGVPGVSVNNDPAFHLTWADLLREGSDPYGLIAEGYPLGPHSLVAALGELTGDVEGAFVGLLLATPVLTALAALAALEFLPPARRAIAAALTGLAYLAAANLAQAAFKEPIMALLLVGSAVTVREVGAGRLSPGRAAAVLGLFTAASVSVFSWPGVAWPPAVAVTFLVATRLVGGEDPLAALRGVEPRRLAAGAAAALAAAVAFAVLAAGPLDLIGGRDIVALTIDGPGGNLIGPVSFYEVTGVWPVTDFREPLGAVGLTRLVGAAAIASALAGGWWWWRRRDVAVPSAVVAGLAIYVVTRAVAAPYVDFKTLGIVASVTMLMVAGGLLAAAPPLRELAGRRAATPAWAWAGLAVVFLGAAAWSSALALRGAVVSDDAHADGLEQLRPRLQGQPTIFLGKDDYALWELRGAHLGAVFPYGFFQAQIPVAVRKSPFTPGAPTDFDTPRPASLDQFRFAVAPDTAYASVPPPNWRRVATGGAYALWERRGPTPRRQILAEGVAPGAVLDCDSRGGRALVRRGGSALVRPGPVVGDPAAWRLPSGEARPPNVPDTIEAGQTVSQTLRLAPGRWELSLQYLGTMALDVRAPGVRATLPANPELPGPWWRVGTVTARGGPVEVSVTARRTPRIGVRRTAAIGTVAAVRLDRPARTVPLSRACGRYVDSYLPARERRGAG